MRWSLDDLRSRWSQISGTEKRCAVYPEIWLLIHISAADLFSLDEICCCWQLERREHLCCLSTEMRSGSQRSSLSSSRDHLCAEIWQRWCAARDHPEIISVLFIHRDEICFLLSSCRKKQFLSLRDENQLFLTAEIRTVLNCFLFCSFILLYLQHRDKYNFILFYFVLISAKYISVSVWNAAQRWKKNIYLFIFVLISAKYISVWNKK